MIDTLLTILFCSLFCFGWWIVTDKGMIAYPLKQLADKYLPDFLYKPLFGCVICFSSIYGGSLYWIVASDYLLLLPSVVAIAGLNYILVQKYGS